MAMAAAADMVKVTADADAIKMKTAVVILNWNTRDLLERYLPLLIRSVEGRDAQVIVADNASTDGSVELLQQKFPDTPVLLFDRNYGFTGGYNKALAGIDAEYFVLINSDIEVQEGWLDPLTEWMDHHPDCGACAPKLHSALEKDRFEYAGAAGGCIDRFGYPFCRGRVMKWTEKDEGQYDQAKEVFWASGACLMTRSSLWKEMGGLDDRFFAHMEEIDLCWRMQLAGWKIDIVPQSTVWHIGGATLPQNSPWKLYLNYRNNLLMLCSNLSRTFALENYKQGMTAADAAKAAKKKTWRLIFTRMCMDGLSGICYLLMLKPKYLKAVWDAHKDFRHLRSEYSAEEIEAWLAGTPGIKDFKVKGIYGKSILWQALIRGKKVFKHITELS